MRSVFVSAECRRCIPLFVFLYYFSYQLWLSYGAVTFDMINLLRAKHWMLPPSPAPYLLPLSRRQSLPSRRAPEPRPNCPRRRPRLPLPRRRHAWTPLAVARGRRRPWLPLPLASVTPVAACASRHPHRRLLSLCVGASPCHQSFFGLYVTIQAAGVHWNSWAGALLKVARELWQGQAGGSCRAQLGAERMGRVWLRGGTERLGGAEELLAANHGELSPAISVCLQFLAQIPSSFNPSHVKTTTQSPSPLEKVLLCWGT
jgi:hypothetical protein